jgi:hypothetical protein
VTAGTGRAVLGTFDGSERGKGDVMGQQSIRQEARRTALDAQSKRRRERAAREKRLEDLVVRVLVAVRERDAAVADAERRAGQALREMIKEEGLSVRETVEWCGDEITTREATRLCRLVEDYGAVGFEADDKNSTADAAEGLAREASGARPCNDQVAGVSGKLDPVSSNP